MKRTKTLLLLLIFPTLITLGQTPEQQSVNEFNSGKTLKYSTLGEGKSQGLKLHFKYPESWKSIDGDRPHVVKKFASTDNHSLSLILIDKMEKPFKQSDINDLFTTSGLKSILPAGATYISSDPNLKIEGLKSGCVEYTHSAQRVDRTFYTHAINYVFVFKEYFVTIQFMVINEIDESKENTDTRFTVQKSLFKQMFNSIIIDNIWSTK